MDLNPEKAAQGFQEAAEEYRRAKQRMGGFDAKQFTAYELLAVSDGAEVVVTGNRPCCIEVAFKGDECPAPWISCVKYYADIFDGAGGFVVYGDRAPTYR